MKTSELKINGKYNFKYNAYLAMYRAVFPDTSIAQYRALVLDYDFDCATYKFIRCEKK